MGLQIKDIHIGTKSNRRNLLLLIHGLGAADHTWIFDETDWIRLLMEDPQLNVFDIALVRYDTAHLASNSLSSLGLREIPFIKQKVTIEKKNKLTELDILVWELKREIDRVDIQSYENIYIIGHSMGGLIGLGYLLQELDNDSNRVVKGFISLATPYNGSAIAGVNDLVKKLHPHDQISDLVPNSEFLDQLIRLGVEYKEALEPMCSFAFGTDDKVVPKESAVPHFAVSIRSSGIPLPGSHSGILEATNHQHPTYIYVRDQIVKWHSKAKVELSSTPNIINHFFSIASNFHGRDPELQDIRRMLLAGGAVFITGMVGIGKTQLAVRYLSMYKHQYKMICWVRAETYSSMMKDLHRFWQEIANDADKETYDEFLILGHVRNWMEQNCNYLFIFDNVKIESKISLLLPSMKQGHVIVTSQNELIEHASTHLPLKPLTKDESLKLLVRLTGREEDDYAVSIIEYFGRLPLSIVHVGAFIRQSNRTYEQVYHLLLYRPADVKKRIGTATSAESSFENLIDMILQELVSVHPESLDFLILLSFLSPDCISLEWFEKQTEISRLVSVFEDELLYDDVRLALLKFSFINQSDYTSMISMHRLLQSTIRERLSFEEKREWHRQVTSLFNRLMQIQTLTPSDYRKRADLVDHIQALAEYYEEDMKDREFLTLLNNTGHYLNEIAQYAVAFSLFEFVSNHYKRISGIDEASKAKILSNMGLVLKRQNQYQEASVYYSQALRTLEQGNHTETIEFATCLMNAGRLEMDLGHYDQSHDKLLRALDLAEQLLPEYDSLLVNFLNNYGLILQSLNRKGAYQYFIRALKLLMRLEQLDTVMAATVYNNLSCDLMKRKKPRWSILALQKSLKIDIDYYGDKHPVLAYRYDNLFNSYLYIGDHRMAMRNLKIAYKIRRKYFELDHPSIGILFLKYGYLLIARNKLEEGKKWVLRSLNIDEQFYKDSLHIELEPALNQLTSIQMKLVKKLLGQESRDIGHLKQMCKEGGKYVRRSLKINYSDEKVTRLNYFQRTERDIRKGKIHSHSVQKQAVNMFIEFKDGSMVVKVLD